MKTPPGCRQGLPTSQANSALSLRSVTTDGRSQGARVSLPSHPGPPHGALSYQKRCSIPSAPPTRPSAIHESMPRFCLKAQNGIESPSSSGPAFQRHFKLVGTSGDEAGPLSCEEVPSTLNWRCAGNPLNAGEQIRVRFGHLHLGWRNGRGDRGRYLWCRHRRRQLAATTGLQRECDDHQPRPPWTTLQCRCSVGLTARLQPRRLIVMLAAAPKWPFMAVPASSTVPVNVSASELAAP